MLILRKKVKQIRSAALFMAAVLLLCSCFFTGTAFASEGDPSPGTNEVKEQPAQESGTEEQQAQESDTEERPALDSDTEEQQGQNAEAAEQPADGGEAEEPAVPADPGPPVYIEEGSVDTGAGTAVVCLRSLKGMTSAKRVSFAVWSMPKQANLIWYQAVKQEDGTYKAAISLKNHKYQAGTYSVHCYAVTSAEKAVFQGSVNLDMPSVKGSLTATENENGTYTLTISGASWPGGIKSIRFPTWSVTNGQDDLIWYTAAKQSDGSYALTVDPAKHKHAGKFTVHTYVTDPAGGLHFLLAGSFQADPVRGKVLAQENGDGTFTVTLSGAFYPGGIKKVQFPTWSKVNGQDDIIWHTAVKQSDGSYTAVIDPAKHKGTGTFLIHGYVTDAWGKKQYQSQAAFEVESKPFAITVEPNSDGTSCAIRAVNAVKADGSPYQRVSVAVWSAAGGQDDLVWCTGVYSGANTWKVTANGSSHKHNGRYSAHVYGDGKYIGGTGFSMETPGSVLTAAQTYSQLIVVSGYNTTYATVSMYTKTGDTWTTEFSVKGRVGSGGIGQALSTKPVTPRGMFTLHTPFGIKPNPGCPLGYTQVNASHYWSDATNRLVTYRTSGEHLIDCGAAYNYCVAIGYNLEGVPSKGSAFFLHCPISSGGATAGCVSIPEANMITVLKKLRPDARIIIDTSGNISKY